ncbi:MAG TPA: LysM peptidoglycan-binding domain-containing protein [Firmicutes bacterium]|nr:LysM peptidoglycan-binding domain-containing protein [Bacillota bacterium]HHY98184.1 LysM peptidoglycan-binding domain-containing protein [Bacillota bacterium]
MVSYVEWEVGPGDTLASIAQRFGVTVEDILAANPEITDPNLIYVGQVIRIPRAVAPSAMPAPGVSAIPPAAPVPPGWCCFVIYPREGRVPDPGVVLAHPAETSHIYVATMSMPAPSSFGSNFSIYAAWIVRRDGTVRNFIDLMPAQNPQFWVNHKDIAGLETTDFLRVSPEAPGHPLVIRGPIVLEGRFTSCR